MNADRPTVIAHLQRTLLPFLPVDAIDARLAEVEAGGVLTECSDGRAYDLVATLNACFFDHPAFFAVREQRVLDDEVACFDRLERGESVGARRYRIAQRVRIDGRALPEGSLLQLFLPAPRDVDGLQRARLVSAEPAGLAEYYLAHAGLVYAAPLVTEAGRALPSLELIYEVDTHVTADAFPADRPGEERGPPSPEVAAWALAHAPKPGSGGEAIVNAMVDALEDELQFALIGRVDAPARVLLAAGAGDVSMHAAMLTEALRCLGLSARIGAAQPLLLDGGKAHLWYPRSAGYEHVFVQWWDRESGEAGTVDLAYLGRWGFVSHQENAPDPDRRAALERAGHRGRSWMRRRLYPLDLIVAGVAPPSRVHVFSTGEDRWQPAPVDVEILAERIDRGDG